MSKNSIPVGHSHKRVGPLQLDFLQLPGSGVVFVEAFGTNALGQKTTGSVKFGMNAAATIESAASAAARRLQAHAAA